MTYAFMLLHGKGLADEIMCVDVTLEVHSTTAEIFLALINLPQSIDPQDEMYRQEELTIVTLNAIRTFAPLFRNLSDVFRAPGERAPTDADHCRIR